MNLVAGRIDVVVFQGAAVRLLIHMDGEEIISDVIEKEFEQRDLKQGDQVYVYCSPDAFLVFPEGGGDKMNPVEPSGTKFSTWFSADNLFTGVIMAFLLVILVVFLLYPVVDICRLSFFKDGVFTLQNYVDYFSEPRIFRSFYNSMFVSMVTMVITTVLAFLFAYGLTRTTMPGKGFFYTVSTLPLIAPTIIQALALILLFGRNGDDHTLSSRNGLEYLRRHGDHRRRDSLLFSECPFHPLYHAVRGGYAPRRSRAEPGRLRDENLLQGDLAFGEVRDRQRRGPHLQPDHYRLRHPGRDRGTIRSWRPKS